MNLKSITAQSVVALSLVSVCSMSQAGFLDNLFSSSTKEPVALSTTTQEIMKNHPVWVIDGKDTSAWSVVEGKKPRRGAAPLLLKQDRGDLGLIPAQTDAGYIATKTEKISLSYPTSIVFEKNGTALLKFGASKSPVQIGIKLRAFDVSGLKMSEFLKNRKGEPLAEAEKVGNAVGVAGDAFEAERNGREILQQFVAGGGACEVLVDRNDHFVIQEGCVGLVGNRSGRENFITDFLSFGKRFAFAVFHEFGHL